MAAPPSPAPVGLGEAWIAGAVAAEMAVVCGLGVALWIYKRRRGHLKSTTAEQVISLSFCGAACGDGRVPAVALGIWRIVNLIWFSAYALADWSGCTFDYTWADCDTTTQNEFPRAYTHWNFRLQPFYWAAVLLATVLNASSCGRSLPRLTSRLNASAHGLLEICVTSAWLISLVVFIILSPGHPSIFYDRYHFINTLCLTIEFAVSRFDVRLGHFVLMLAWMMLYVVYAWIMRATHWNEFPYFFMKLDSSKALMWYPIVAVMKFAVYCVFVALSVLTRRHPCLGSHEGHKHDEREAPLRQRSKEGAELQPAA
jgi:hypothetical protein